MRNESLLATLFALFALTLASACSAVLVPYTSTGSVSVGFGHACALSTAGDVSCWGRGLEGQLGTGLTEGSATPLPVSGLPDGITAVAAGKTHGCAIAAGAAYCWGTNTYGELGNGSKQGSLTPVAVSGLNGGVTAIAVGDFSSCAIVNGGAFCWGNNTYGSLGDGSGVDSTLPVPVSGLGSGVTALSVGVLHACAIAAGAARCWGNDFSGQLGDGPAGPVALAPVAVSGFGSGVTRIVAGAVHSCGIVNNVAYCWGANDQGQLGSGDQVPSAVPQPVAGLDEAQVLLAVGALHACAVDVQGEMHCWGDGGYGQLGYGGVAGRLSPVNVEGIGGGVIAIGARGFTSCAVRADHRLKCWGFNAYGQVGEGSAEYRTAPQPVLDLSSGVSAIAAGASHTCAVANGVAECWGYNGLGNLGNGTTSLYAPVPAPVQSLPPIATSIASGFDHSCAIVAGGVWCWGSNEVGQLGDGTTTQSERPVAVQGLGDGVTRIALGGRQSCAIRNGAARCWGYNGNGELGDGTTVNSPLPVRVSGLNSGVSAISVGPNHSCAIVNGAAMCWGVAFSGQLGDGSIEGFRAEPVFVSGMTNASDIAAGYGHTCAIAGGVAKCWGYNGYGQLGVGDTDDRIFPAPVAAVDGIPSAITAADDLSCAVVSGSTRCWGGDYYGDLGNGGPARTRRLVPTPVIGLSGNSVAVTANGTHACALTVSGALRCWGDDFTGQLGIGREVLVKKPVDVLVEDTVFANAFD